MEEAIGDAAYSTKNNITFAQESDIDLVAKLNPSVSHGNRKEEDQYVTYRTNVHTSVFIKFNKKSSPGKEEPI